jgi:hypothetical protein
LWKRSGRNLTGELPLVSFYLIEESWSWYEKYISLKNYFIKDNGSYVDVETLTPLEATAFSGVGIPKLKNKSRFE